MVEPPVLHLQELIEFTSASTSSSSSIAKHPVNTVAHRTRSAACLARAIANIHFVSSNAKHPANPWAGKWGQRGYLDGLAAKKHDWALGLEVIRCYKPLPLEEECSKGLPMTMPNHLRWVGSSSEVGRTFCCSFSQNASGSYSRCQYKNAKT